MGDFILRPLCWIGLHRLHPSALITGRIKGISKLVCTRCGKRKWWKQPARRKGDMP